MPRTLVALLILRCLSVSQSGPKQDEALKPYEIPEAYEVYASILNTKGTGDAKPEPALIVGQTVPFKLCVDPNDEPSPAVKEALRDYEDVNSRSWLLQPRFQLNRPYSLITEKEMQAWFKDHDLREGWRRFHAEHPDTRSMIRLSAVGFSADKKVAVVFSGYSCDVMCGGGELRVFQKKDGTWHESGGDSTCLVIVGVPGGARPADSSALTPESHRDAIR